MSLKPPVGCPAHVPADRVFPFNFRADPALEAEPWAVLHGLRERPPIFYSPDLGGHWVVSSMDLVKDILRNHEVFTTNHARVPPLEREVWSIPHHVDPPDHTKYRKSMIDAFTPRATLALEDEIRATAVRLIEGFAERGRCEFMSAYAQQLPVQTFLQLAGIAPERGADFIPSVQAYAQGTSEAQAQAGHRNIIAFLTTWLDEQLATTHELPGHLLPALAAAEVDGRALTRDEILSIVYNVFTGGFDTIASQMSHIVRFLAESPVHRRHLVDNPAAIPEAVEEMLRRFSIISIARRVKSDIDYHGVTFKAGDLVLCLITASGIDENAFPDAMTVDFERSNRRQHCAFGTGIHVCPGAPLARLELQITLEEALPRLPNLRLQPDAKVVYYLGMATGARTLPLEWDA
jgi:cytochrome P450